MDELNEKIKRVFADLGIRCVYDMPSFWANGGKDYVVIPTRYAKGYQDALEDAEREITEVLSEQPEQPLYVAEIEAEYQKAVKMPHIHKPLAKALYEVWKKHDREDAERRTDDCV